MNELKKRIEEVETNIRLLRQNATHYYWTMNDDITGDYWQNLAREDEKLLAELKGELAILEKWAEVDAK
jgi:hypothetical protein